MLVVEDDPIHRRALLKTLHRIGLDGDVADNGRSALEAIQRRFYPLILMDCEMPVLDGYQTALEIRRHASPEQRPVIIAVTAYPVALVRARVEASGMDDCVAKPVDIESFSELLDRWWIKVGTATASSAPATVASSAPESALDPSVQRSAAVIRVFLTHAPLQLDAVGAAIRANDAAALRRAAHTLKGSCLVLGVPRMASLSAALEASPANRAQLYAELTREAERVWQHLETSAD